MKTHTKTAALVLAALLTIGLPACGTPEATSPATGTLAPTVPLPEIGNAGFESGELDPWIEFGGGAVAGEEPHSGSYCGVTGTTLSSIEQTITGLSPSTAYTLVGYARVAVAGETVDVGVKNYGGDSLRQSVTGDSYQQVTIEFVTGLGSTSAKIFCSKREGSGIACCDDFSLSGGTPVPTPTPRPTPVWTLVWSDEFDGPEIDASTWGYEIGYIRNNEEQYYTDRPENSFIEDGVLVIEGRDEEYEGFAYTSASLNTKGTQEFTYGKIEARLSIPMGQGLWPAFWTLGANIDGISWPECGEIDVMEHVNSETMAHGTAHWGDGIHRSSGSSMSVSDPVAWHVYAVEWDEVEIRWYVDGVYYHTVNVESPTMSEFHEAHYILLNLAIGGTWPGAPAPETEFPARYMIDWVRVYQEQ